jgi:hypothetical protein
MTRKNTAEEALAAKERKRAADLRYKKRNVAKCSARRAAWSRANPERQRAIAQRSQLRALGVDPATVPPKSSGCQVCGRSRPGKNSIVVDHCHVTGSFRGWLCNNCNVSIGMSGDNPAMLRRLADYLEEHSRAA